jgi:hypothetical protein
MQLKDIISLGLLGFWTLSIVWYSRKLVNTRFEKLDMLLSSGEGGDTYSAGSLEKS